MIGTRKGQRRPESGRDRVLADPDVRRWYEDLQRGSKATGDVYVRRLWAFCQSVGESPADLARLS
ncbi:MAG TPA: hypothetical protein VGS23_08490 [Thermoplasmata archaeon]|nr:hypothetical protein [Thermoplasmata archaeon]